MPKRFKGSLESSKAKSIPRRKPKKKKKKKKSTPRSKEQRKNMRSSYLLIQFSLKGLIHRPLQLEGVKDRSLSRLQKLKR